MAELQATMKASAKCYEVEKEELKLRADMEKEQLQLKTRKEEKWVELKPRKEKMTQEGAELEISILEQELSKIELGSECASLVSKLKSQTNV